MWQTKRPELGVFPHGYLTAVETLSGPTTKPVVNPNAATDKRQEVFDENFHSFKNKVLQVQCL